MLFSKTLLTAALLATTACAAPAPEPIRTLKNDEVSGNAMLQYGWCVYNDHPYFKWLIGDSAMGTSVYSAPGQHDQVVTSNKYRTINPARIFSWFDTHKNKQAKMSINYDKDRRVKFTYDNKIAFETNAPHEIITDGPKMQDFCAQGLIHNGYSEAQVKELKGYLDNKHSYYYVYKNVPNVYQM